jgi:regulator of sigma E protease
MFDTLLTIISFIAVLGILITVHEYGHFIVARFCGVKVLRFSIGFGRPLWRHVGKVDQTEYVIAAIPLGGYVKMVDEREGEVNDEELPYAFNRQSLARRVAIVSAGPLFNLVFAVMVYWVMFINGVPGSRALISEPLPQTPAASAQLMQHDEIVGVAGSPTPTWQAVLETILPMALLHQAVELDVMREGNLLKTILPLDHLQNEVTGETFTDMVGLKPLQINLPAVIDTVIDGTAADKYGLKPGDEIIAIDDVTIAGWSEMVQIIRANPGRPLMLTVKRDVSLMKMEIRPETVISGDSRHGKIGASVRVDAQQFQAYQSIWQFGPVAALGAAVEKSWKMSVLTLKMIGKMVVGEASVENLSGPITIARYAKSSVSAGFSQLLGFIAIISISLGVLNLLPIPILDGGHLFFYLIEWIKGTPVSQQVEAVGQQVGLIIIFFMMSLAIYNDVARLVQ